MGPSTPQQVPPKHTIPGRAKRSDGKGGAGPASTLVKCTRSLARALVIYRYRDRIFPLSSPPLFPCWVVWPGPLRLGLLNRPVAERPVRLLGTSHRPPLRDPYNLGPPEKETPAAKARSLPEGGRLCPMAFVCIRAFFLTQPSHFNGRSSPGLLAGVVLENLFARHIPMRDRDCGTGSMVGWSEAGPALGPASEKRT